MKQFIFKNKQALMGMGAALLLGCITMSFQDSPFLQQKFDPQQTIDDTVPDKKCGDCMKMKDFDKLTQDLDKTLMEVGVEMKKIDFDQIQQDVEKALKDVDMNKIMKDVESAVKNIDLDKIIDDIKSSVKDINWDEKNGEISMAMSEARKEIVKASAGIHNIDRAEIEKAMEQTKKELEKTKLEFKKVDMDKIMEEAKKGINKAKEELKLPKAMFNEMEKDGLVDPKQGFSIEYKEKEFYINGTKQSERVTDKYRKYFTEDHFKIKIDKE